MANMKCGKPKTKGYVGAQEMVEETHGVRWLLRKLAIRIGEGLVIGLGVAMALGGYNAVVNATDQLETARKRLEAQETINERLSAIAGESRRADGALESEYTDIKRSLHGVVSRMEAIERALENSGPVELPDSSEWSDLKDRTQERWLPDVQLNRFSAMERHEAIEDLDELIREQKRIQ